MDLYNIVLKGPLSILLAILDSKIRKKSKQSAVKTIALRWLKQSPQGNPVFLSRNNAPSESLDLADFQPSRTDSEAL